MTSLETPFGFHSTTSDVLKGVDLSGKTALVTGANAGIGCTTARALAGTGAAVVVAARRDLAGRDAAAQIAESTGNRMSRTSGSTWQTSNPSRGCHRPGMTPCTS